jgi:hypothetical protein
MTEAAEPDLPFQCVFQEVALPISVPSMRIGARN